MFPSILFVSLLFEKERKKEYKPIKWKRALLITGERGYLYAAAAAVQGELPI